MTAPSRAELAAFTGRDPVSFTDFADQALAQATLLFSVLTHLTVYPDDADRSTLAHYAILQMADRIYQEQPYATIAASPFISETAGSYSYSKSVTVTKAQLGQLTGLFWWDLALDELADIDRSLVVSGSIGVFEHDIWIEVDTGRQMILGPAQLNTGPSGSFDVNAETYPRDPIP